MGAPKQKWTPAEEAALKAGILKHGPSKWSAILKDSEFSNVLRLRSNVDLKDKWRNMSVTANGWGSRDRARLAMKRNQALKKDENQNAIVVGENQSVVLNPTPIAISAQMAPTNDPKKPIGSFDDVILEAITSLKEPTGSNKTSISMLIEVKYNLPTNFKQTFTIKLAELVESRKLVKVKRKYRLPSDSGSVSKRVTTVEKKMISECPEEKKDAPLPMVIDSERESPECLAIVEMETSENLAVEEMKETPQQLMIEEKKDTPAVFENKPLKRNFTKTQIDFDLRNMFNMTEEEAASAAAHAVAEAELALAEAEAAAAEAEEAEAYAEELHIVLAEEKRRHKNRLKKLKISSNERSRNSGWGA